MKLGRNGSDSKGLLVMMLVAISSALLFYAEKAEGMIYITLMMDHPTMGQNVSYLAEPAAFGPDFTQSLTARLFLAEPLTGCDALVNSAGPSASNETFAWVALIQRGDCNFETKVLNAQNAGASFAVVFNNLTTLGNSLVTMSPGADGGSQINIPSAFITKESGYDLMDLLLQQQNNNNNNDPNPSGSPSGNSGSSSSSTSANGLPIVITMDGSSGPFQSMDSQWAVIVFIGILAILISSFFIMIFLIVEIYRQRRRRRHRRRPKPTPVEVVITIPTKEMVAEDLTEDKNITCAICLDDFEVGTKVRHLPCDHEFHQDCIDPWLMKHNHVCPVCKQDIVQGIEIKKAAGTGESIEMSDLSRGSDSRLSDLSRLSSSSQRDSNLETVVIRDGEYRLPPCPEETETPNNLDENNDDENKENKVNKETVIQIENENDASQQNPEEESEKEITKFTKRTLQIREEKEKEEEEEEEEKEEEDEEQTQGYQDDMNLVEKGGKEGETGEGKSDELDQENSQSTEQEREKKRERKGKGKLLAFFKGSSN